MFTVKILGLALLMACGARAQFISVGGNGQPGYSSPTPALIQQVAATSGNCSQHVAGTYTCVLPSSPTAPNVLIYTNISQSGVTSGFTQVPSSTGAAWSLAGNAFQNTIMFETWCATLSGSPSGTVTITPSSGTANNALGTVAEFSGTTCTVDGALTGKTGSSSTSSTATLMTANAKDVLIAFTGASGTLSSGPTNSFAEFTRAGGSEGIAYLITSAAGSYSTAWTWSASGAWASSIVAFEN